MANVKINLNEFGTGTVEIDGVNIAKAVRKTIVITEAGQPTRIVLELWAHAIDAHVSGEVLAKVRTIDEPGVDIDTIVNRVVTRM